MNLDEQIELKSKEVSTESYGMSVGELLSLYKEGELNLHPEFQRFFRWSDEQKSRLIESLVLGIPIPPIFVSQDPKGKWDVIDGLQRLSTIFELAGELIGEDNEKRPELVLKPTKYLPGFAGMRWGAKDEEGIKILSDTTKLIVKRARLDVKIVLNKSDTSSKYELFDRLNTGGSAATPQEVRNCLLLMINRGFFESLTILSKDPNFIECIPLTERQVAEQYPMELVVRFLTLRLATRGQLAGMADLGPYLTDRIVEFAEDSDFDLASEEKAFHRTFKILSECLTDDSFRRFNQNKSRSEGAFLISLFEIIALGIGHFMADDEFTIEVPKILDIHHTIWNNQTFTKGTGSGVRPTSRLPVTILLGRDLFRP